MKRCICLLLVVLILIGSLPTAFAAELPESETAPTENSPSEMTRDEETTATDAESTEIFSGINPAEDTPSAGDDAATLPEEDSGKTEVDAAEEQPHDEEIVLDDTTIMDGLSMGNTPSLMSISGTDTGILLFNYADNGNYTTVLNSQVAVTYRPNGTGAAKTAYIKNMGWHFARYNNKPYPDSPLYCIEPHRDFAASTSGNRVDRDVTLTGSGTTQGSNVWYALPQARREAIGLVLLYSDQMWNHSISVTNTSKANNPNVPLRIATQMLIYEIVCGMREDGTFNRLSRNESGSNGAAFYNAGNASVPGFASNYNSLVSYVQNAMKIPSFTSQSYSNAPTITMTDNATTVTDNNGVLSGWSFINGNGVSFSKSGNNLTITKTGNISDSTVMTATRSIPSASNTTYNLWYMTGSSYQTTISLYRASSSTANAYFKLDPPADPTGTLSIQKTTEDGKNLGGWQFELFTDAACTSRYSSPHTTDASGTLTISDLKAGTYYVKETGNTDTSINAQYYCASTNPQTVVITAGGTATLTFTNNLATGGVKLVKTTNTGENLAGWRIGLYTDADCTMPISGSPFTTGADGTVSVSNLLPGTYYAREYAVDDAYWECDTSTKTVTVVANATVEVSFSNTHYGSIEIHKTTNTGNHLEGWVFCVADDNSSKLGEYTSDKDGIVRIDHLLPGRYIVWEKNVEDDPYWTIELGYHPVTVVPGTAVIDEWKNTEVGLGIFKKVTNTGDNLGGWEVTLYEDEACTKAIRTYTTETDGQIAAYIAPGVYFAKETGDNENRFDDPFWNIDSSVHRVEIKPHEDTEVTFENIHCGKIHIVKTVKADGSAEGWEISIKDAQGKEIEGSPFTTDKDGVILTDNLIPGMYTLEELIPEDSLYYCKSENPLTIAVKAGEIAEAAFTNDLRPARIWIEKVDNIGKHLPGATFKLEWSADNGKTWADVFYSEQEDVVKGGCSNREIQDGCLISDSQGELAWEHLYPGLRYRVTEVKAPDGFTRLRDTAFDDTITGDDLEITIRVINNHNFVLPKTGSASLRIVSLFGAVVMTASLLVIANNLRKKR